MRKSLAFVFASLFIFVSCRNTVEAPVAETLPEPTGFPRVGDVRDSGIDITNEATACGIHIVWSYLNQLAMLTNLTGNNLVVRYLAEARSDYMLPDWYLMPQRLKAGETKIIAHMVRRGGEVVIGVNDGKNSCRANFVLGR